MSLFTASASSASSAVVKATVAVALLLLVALVSSPRAARNGAIRGRVELRRAPAPIERRPGVADLGTAERHDLPNLLRSVV